MPPSSPGARGLCPRPLASLSSPAPLLALPVLRRRPRPPPSRFCPRPLHRPPSFHFSLRATGAPSVLVNSARRIAARPEATRSAKPALSMPIPMLMLPMRRIAARTIRRRTAEHAPVRTIVRVLVHLRIRTRPKRRRTAIRTRPIRPSRNHHTPHQNRQQSRLVHNTPDLTPPRPPSQSQTLQRSTPPPIPPPFRLFLAPPKQLLFYGNYNEFSIICL